MKAVQKSSKWSFSRIIFCVAFGIGTNAMGADTPPQPAAPATSQGKSTPKVLAEPKSGTPFAAVPGARPAGGSPAVSEPLMLKVFRLQRADPHGFTATALLLLNSQGGNEVGIGGMLGGIGSQVPGGLPPGAQLGGIGGIGGLGFGGGFGAPFAGGIGGIGGIGGMPAGIAGPTRFVVDVPSRTLLVRGPERDLLIVADLVTVLDAAPGKPTPKVKHLNVFRLKHADPQQVAAAVTQLGIEARVAPVEEGDFHKIVEEDQRFLFAIGSEEQIGQIRQVIEAMDVRVNHEDEDAPQNPPPAPRRPGKAGKGRPQRPARQDPGGAE